MQSSVSRPYVVTVIPATPNEATPTTVSDLLIGTVSMVGLMLAVALVLGAALGGIRLAIRKYFRTEADHMPTISPLGPDSTLPPPPPR